MNYSLEITSDKEQNLLLQDKIRYSNSGEVCLENDKLGKLAFRNEYKRGFVLSDIEILARKELQIKTTSIAPVFALYFILDGNIRSSIAGGRHDDKLWEGKNNIWTFPEDISWQSVYVEKDLFRSFGITFDTDYLEELVNRYPDLLSNIYNEFIYKHDYCLQDKHLSTTAEMNLAISQIHNAYTMGSVSDLYTESKVLELIALQINTIRSKEKKTDKLHCSKKRDLDKIYEAKHLLLSDIANPPSISSLSKMIGMDEKKLKYAFKEVFQQTIYGCLFEHKMIIARQLLLDTERTIFEIALDCGYEYSSHFTTAFKRRFGVTPRKYREAV